MLTLFRFRKGKYSTKFIPEQYPKGFHGVQLSQRETLELISAAAAMHQTVEELSADVQKKREAAAAASEQDEEGSGAVSTMDEEYVVVLGGPKGRAYRVTLRLVDELEISITPINDAGDASGKVTDVHVCVRRKDDDENWPLYLLRLKISLLCVTSLCSLHFLFYMIFSVIIADGEAVYEWFTLGLRRASGACLLHHGQRRCDKGL